MHAVRAYRYIRGETMNNVVVNSEISSNFGFFVGNLTSVLQVIIYFLNKYLLDIYRIVSKQFIINLYLEIQS